jgi:hypothetical protein
VLYQSQNITPAMNTTIDASAMAAAMVESGHGVSALAAGHISAFVSKYLGSMTGWQIGGTVFAFLVAYDQCMPPLPQ